MNNTTSAIANADTTGWYTMASSMLISNALVTGALGVALFAYISAQLSTAAVYFIAVVRERFICSITIQSDDSLFGWMETYLASKSRCRTGSARGFVDLSTHGDMESTKPKIGLVSGFGKMRFLSFTHRGRNYWILLTYSEASNVGGIGGLFGSGSGRSNAIMSGNNKRRERLKLSMFSSDNSILLALLEHARDETLSSDKLAIYKQKFDSWEFMRSRSKREARSVVLPIGQMTLLLDDMNRFLSARAWYERRGLNFQRGYLFEGVPGSGKTSTVLALASQLNLSLCVLSLNCDQMNDFFLARCLSQTPGRSIVLIEDIDAMMINRKIDDNDDDKINDKSSKASKVTLSGLLNAIDGVSSSEGRILIMTTNYPERLDAALTRCGRVDLRVEFSFANNDQIKRLLYQFYENNWFDTDALHDDSTLYEEKSGVKVDFHCESWMMIADSTTLISKIETFARTLRDSLEKQNKDAAQSVSMASLQGHLLMNRDSIDDAIENINALVDRTVKEFSSFKTKKSGLPMSKV